MKRIAILATTGAVLITAGFLIPRVAFADDVTPHDSFTQQLAEKLGLTEDEIQDVMVEIRSEHQAEREAERKEAINTAFENGDLTERQVTILNAMHEVMSKVRNNESTLRGQERRDEMQKTREERDTLVLDSLNEQGLNVTEEEMTTLRETMQDLDLGMGQGMGKGEGFGMGRER